MFLSYDSCGAVILAGGQSNRMGCCKAMLTINGETLVSRLVGQLSAFSELWVSANNPDLREGLPIRLVRDRQMGLGPLAGLQAALTVSERQFLLFVPCDLPNFTAQAAAAMLEVFPPSVDAMVCVDSKGRVHPLCGIYAKSALPIIEQQLLQKNLRLRDLLVLLRCAYFSITSHFSDKLLTNINTPDAFKELCEIFGDDLASKQVCT